MQNLAIILGQYMAQYAKTRMAYKSDFLVSCMAGIIATVAGYGFVLILFTRIPHLQGWHFEEILFIYGFSLIPMGMFNIVSLNLYEFGDVYIVEGKFDRILLRPVHSLFQVMFENFRFEAVQEIVVGLLVVVYCGVRLKIPWSVANLALFPMLILSGAIIYLGIFIMIASVGFWFEDRIGLSPPVYNMIAFGRYPVTIYSPVIQFVLNWIIPFAFASFYPTTRFLGRTEFLKEFYLVPFVAAALAGLAIFIWNRGVTHYKSTGS